MEAAAKQPHEIFYLPLVGQQANTYGLATCLGGEIDVVVSSNAAVSVQLELRQQQQNQHQSQQQQRLERQTRNRPPTYRSRPQAQPVAAETNTWIPTLETEMEGAALQVLQPCTKQRLYPNLIVHHPVSTVRRDVDMSKPKPNIKSGKSGEDDDDDDDQDEEVVSSQLFLKSGSTEEFLAMTTIITNDSSTNSALPQGTLTLLQCGPEPSPSTWKEVFHIIFDFTPFAMLHVVDPNTRQDFLLLSGSHPDIQSSLHMYDMEGHDLLQIHDEPVGDKTTTTDNVHETQMISFVSHAFQHCISDCITSMDFHSDEEVGSLLAFGCHGGTLVLARDASNSENEQHEFWSVSFDGVITFVRLVMKDGVIHLLVGCGNEQAVIYINVIENSLRCAETLEESNVFDSVLCGASGWSGSNQCKIPTPDLVIGTYGCQVLGYSLTTSKLAEGVLHDGGDDTSQEQRHTKMLWRMELDHPVMGICWSDVLGDGIPELLVLTMFALHVFQIE